MEILLIKYGYLLLFLGVMVEGEAFILAAAFLAHRGILQLPFVIVVAVLANCTADQIYFMMARSRGRAWLEQRFGDHPRYQRTMDWMTRSADWLLLASRYAFGFRIIIPAACGAIGMPMIRFVILNTIAGIVWAVPTAFLGFYAGNAASAILAGIRRYELWILLALGLAAAIALLIRHVRRAEWFADLTPADLHSLVPLLIGIMGSINLLSALWPRSHASLQVLETWLPLEVTQRSRPLMIFAGVALLQVTRNLARRKELAWYASVIALVVSFATHITRALDLHHSLVAGLLLAYLFYFRRRYYARSDPASLRRVFWMAPLLLLIVYLYGYIGLSHRPENYQWYDDNIPAAEAFRSGILIIEPHLDPKTEHAARFLGSLQIAGWIARFYLLLLILRPVILRRRMEASEASIRDIFRKYSRFSLSAFAIQSDKHHLLVMGGRGLVAYAVRGSVVLACGDPIAPEEDFQGAVSEYIEYARKNGWTPCIYEGSESRLPVYQAHDCRSLKMAEEAIIDLKEFSLAGGKRATLRAMVNKAAKSGMVVQRYDRAQKPDAAVDEQLEAISQEWLAEKHMGELGFTLGRFSLDSLTDIPVFVVLLDRSVQAFCSWLPYRGGTAAVLDLMRKRSQALAGTMDFLLAHSLLQLQADGWIEASLANAPLANVTGSRGPLDRGVALLFENMNAFYGYKNLFQFKKKFAPRWEGRYLIYPKGADLPRVAIALTSVHSSGGLMQLLLRR